MELTDGHLLAIEQLNSIASHENGALEIVSLPGNTGDDGWLPIEISFDCSGFESVPEGLPLNQRERVRIYIPSDFPLSVPEAYVQHLRFAFFPHVQWGCYLCLYSSKEVQWNFSDGMFGYLNQLAEWFKRGALNELDETGEALHPPSTFVGERSEFSICVEKKLPGGSATIKMKAAILSRLNTNTLEITEWCDLPLNNNDNYAAVLIVNDKMPFEYPETVRTLFGLLKSKGIETATLVMFLQQIAVHKKTKIPLFLFLCSPMLGIRGSDEKKHHIACWEIDKVAAVSLRTIGKTLTGGKFSDKKRKEAIDSFFEWATKAKVKWCTVYDNREEISVRRDHVSPTSKLRDKRVAVLGCGALGANVAIHSARSGVSKLILADNKEVTPGVLIRQPFNHNQCGQNKAIALKDNVQKIRREIEIEAIDADVSNRMSDIASSEADYVLDCTASNKIHILSESAFKNSTDCRLVSMCVDKDLKNGIALTIGSQYSGGFYDVYRKLIIEACRNGNSRKVIKNFVSSDMKVSFQPVPGCSEPTFTGSNADVSTFSATMLNIALKNLSDDAESGAVSALIAKDSLEEIKIFRFAHGNDELLTDTFMKYSVKISKFALNGIREAIRKHGKKCGKSVETGGFLFGERNDYLKTAWIDIATPPPSD
ncbi:MAG: ThiF family adenylyltransferase, partial [Tissierellales bacterium]|nr:ThiF family adenylyltransferase [Tissierellales bacterium]